MKFFTPLLDEEWEKVVLDHLARSSFQVIKLGGFKKD